MKPEIFFGLIAAIGTGIIVGTQSTLSGRIGSLIGPMPTGLLSNVVSGISATIIILALFVLNKGISLNVPRQTVILLAISGTIGILVVTGAAFAVPRLGVTAAVAAIILGQMLISTLVDSSGWFGMNIIPLDLKRIAGLIVLAVGVYLLLPRSA